MNIELAKLIAENTKFREYLESCALDNEEEGRKSEEHKLDFESNAAIYWSLADELSEKFEFLN